jgi:hypothetical protein
MATVAVFLALGGGAIAATSLTSGDGTITACVAKKSGAVRVVAAGKKCPKGTRKLTWNQAGKPGPQGQPGAPGEPGAAGSPGTAQAYAHVLANGTLDLAHSKGVNGIANLCAVPCSVTHGESAAQCFDLASPAAVGVVSTAPESPFTMATVAVPGPVAEGITVGCPAEYADAEVFTFRRDTGVQEPNAFYVVFN